jgi:hypothetical protein
MTGSSAGWSGVDDAEALRAIQRAFDFFGVGIPIFGAFIEIGPVKYSPYFHFLLKYS